VTTAHLTCTSLSLADSIVDMISMMYHSYSCCTSTGQQTSRSGPGRCSSCSSLWRSARNNLLHFDPPLSKAAARDHNGFYPLL